MPLANVHPRCLGVAILAAVAVSACAHAPPQAAPAAPTVWPEPPAEARVRLAGVLTGPEGTNRKRSFWVRAWRLLVGIDGDENGSARFERPFGVAATGDGGILVADPDAAMVVRTRPGAPASFVECRDHPWVAPMGVASSDGGDVYVADAAAGVVVRRSADGRCAVLGDAVLERPTGLAVRDGRIYVADPPRHHVAVLSPSGELLATIGVHGEGDGELNFPTAVAFDASGALLVVDALNFRVARFGADGAWIGSFGTPLDEGGPFAMPKGIALDEDGRIYVSDAQRDLVVVFRPDGALDYVLGAPGDGPGRFTHPAGVASSHGRVYVADSYARRVQAFDVLGAKP